MNIQVGMFYTARITCSLCPVLCIGFKNSVAQFKDTTERLCIDSFSMVDLEEWGGVIDETIKPTIIFPR